MFREYFEKYRFVFIRFLLVFYPMVLLADATLAKRNAWLMELLYYLVCAFFAFAVGICFEGYYFSKKKQKEYPTRKRFRQTAAVTAIIVIILLYSSFKPFDMVSRIVYTFSRGLLVYPIMESAFFAREVEKDRIKDILLMVPSFVIMILLYFVIPKTRMIYGNIAMLTWVLHDVFFALHYTNLPLRIKDAYEKLKEKGSVGRFLKAWSLWMRKVRNYRDELLKRMRERWKDFTYRFFLFKGLKKMVTDLYRFFRKDRNTKTLRHSDYIDEIDTLFSVDDGFEQVRYTVRGLYKIKDPVKKVRYAFGLVMSDLKEKKVEIRHSDTVTVIEEKSKVIENLDQYMEPLSKMYEGVRYGNRHDGQTAEEAALLAVSADTTIKESYWQPKVYANSDFEFGGSDQA